MKELEYPFDADFIISNKKRIKRQLLENESDFIDKKIALLGGSTTRDVLLVLELFLLNNGIRPTFYESEYNQYYQDAMFPNEQLESFQPDIIYIHTSNRNIEKLPTIMDSEDEIDRMLSNESQKFVKMWDQLTVKYHCPIIQNNFEMPYYRLMGNKDSSDIHGTINYINHLNAEFYAYAQMHDNFYICDINYLAADYGLKAWADPFYWYMYKYALSIPAIPLLSYNIANIIKSILGKNKKGLVLDLDNTLWGGTIGDDGAENIALGPEEAAGQAYSEFQKYIKSHQQLGVILSINSKNDYENAVKGLNHPNSELKPDDFVEIKANWKPKSDNFEEIASDLNVLPESLVLVDDNPMERDIVKRKFPKVSAPDLERVEHYIEVIDRSGFFEVTTLSKDDLNRNKMYKQNAERSKLQVSCDNYEEYLQSLEMKATIEAFTPVYMARIAQLTNKSNQFNLTTRRYTQSELEEISNSSDYITLCGRLEDKFGDNGVVSVVIGHIMENECHIELWLMSCRVLKRNMEFAMMDVMVAKCREMGLKYIKGSYYPTAKNAMVKDFYQLQGFEKIHGDDIGNTEWQLDLTDDYVNKNKVIQIGGIGNE